MLMSIVYPKYKSFIFLLIISILVTYSPVCYAKQPQKNEEEELKDYITTAILSLERIMKEDWDNAIECIRKEIKNRGYDYSLTFSELYEKGNPYCDFDFVKSLAAYTASKKYIEDSEITEKSILDLQFITYEMTPESVEDSEYIKIDDYDLQDNGTYVKTGFHYSTKEQDVGIYKESPGGYYYIKVGEEHIIPSTKITKLGLVEYKVIEPEDIFRQLQIPYEEISKDYQTAISLINQVTNNRILRQNTFINLPKPSADVKDYVPPEDIDIFRKNLLLFANSLRGQIPYQWGGKASVPGYDPTWWTFDEKTGIQKGLDCSGFVQWAFMTAGANKDLYQKLNSTTEILESDFKEIPYADLQPGDIGVRKGIKVNHTGIYAGNGLWFHCSSESNTVVLSNYGFTYYYNVLDTIYAPEEKFNLDGNIDKELGDLNLQNEESDLMVQNSLITEDIEEYSESDVYLLAQLISHEAGGEGFNGWVAVGEVVKNRLESNLFPDTISEVVYQKNPVQFSRTGELAGIIPRNEIVNVARQVLNGKLKILNDSEILFFRNPKITSNIESTTHQDWGDLKYHTYIGNHAFYKRKK